MAGNENPNAAQTSGHVGVDLLRRVWRHHVDRKDANEAIGVRCHTGLHIGVVVAVAGRCLHQRRLGNARLRHGGEHADVVDRPLAGPVGLFAAQRTQRVAEGVGCNHVAVQVHDGKGGRNRHGI